MLIMRICINYYLVNSYRNRDLSAFLMAICQNTVFDLLRNAFLIPYRFNADGKQNPMIMTDENGMLLPEYKRSIHEREYRHFHEVYTDLGAPKNIFLAQAYRYSHSYTSDDMEPEQNILEKNNGVLLIRELPDTVKLKETEAEAYSAILDIVIKDKGVGIADIEQARRPAYTTGGADRSGMGFTIMESFMTNLDIQSSPGKGTTVHMRRKLQRRK